MSEVVNIQKQDTHKSEILNTFSELLLQMTTDEKEKLLVFGEGMGLMLEILKSEKNAAKRCNA